MSNEFPYLNPGLSISERVADLLSRMTIEEKIGQMNQYAVDQPGRLPEDDTNVVDKQTADTDVDDVTIYYTKEEIRRIPQLIRQGCIGSLFYETDPACLNAYQKLANESRLRIPLIFGIDAIHGNGVHSGATIFPAPINWSSSFDLDLVYRITRAAAREIRSCNIHWTFSPNVDLCRDGRWGRVGETFGEDTLLTSLVGATVVKGYQGQLDNPEENILACLKHFVGGGEPPNGLNFAAMDISEKTLRELHLPPYHAAIKAGAGSLMAAHHEISGIPCHANKKLLTHVLRDDFGFKGFVVSDWTDMERLHTLHRIAPTIKDAFKMSINAGIDMHMHGPGFIEPMCELVQEGSISMARIDDAVGRILFAKFKLGLFENRYVNIDGPHNSVMLRESRTIALEAARKSIVLLKNENGLLPLKRTGLRILVTGPNANSEAILGDWVHKQPDGATITILDGLRKVAAKDTEIIYSDCGDLLSISDRDIKRAKEKAKNVDIIIVVVGENPLRYTASKTEGENTDRSDLDLPGRQLELVQALASTGKPIVTVLVNGRPLSIPWIAEHIPAIVEAFHPGSEGGLAVAEILFGEINPSAKLSYTIPRGVGHVRTTYNYKPSDVVRTYILGETAPLFNFGHGMSYTTFEYSNLRVTPKIKADDNIEMKVSIQNTGRRSGDEVILLYIRDQYASVPMPVKQLKAFTKISLEPGEKKEISFILLPESLALVNLDLKWVVEPGFFDVYVGNLHSTFEVQNSLIS